MIDQLISQVAAKIGIDEGMAKQAVGVLMGLIQKEGDTDLVSSLFGQLPGAADLAGEFADAGDSAGGLGGLMGKMGGLMGGDAGDMMSAMAAFKSTGLSMDQAKEMAPVVKDFLTENVDGDVVKQALESVPALKGLLG